MKTLRDKLLDPVYLAYLSLLLLNGIIFCLTDTYAVRDTFAFFCLHFASAAIGLVAAFTFLRGRREGLISVVLLLFLISCYALNRDFELFDKSVPWFSGILVAVSANLLLFRYYAQLPRALQWVVAFGMGLGLMVFLYLAVYLLPWYPVSVPGMLALGLGAHTFIPACIIVHMIMLMRKQVHSLPAKCMLALGAAVPLVVTVMFAVRFNEETHRLNRLFHRRLASSSDLLPPWVEAAMKTERGLVTDCVLKSGMIYRTPVENDMLFSVPRQRMDEPMVHNPLVTIAMHFSPELELDEDNRLRILETLFNARHATQERLWSGDDLKTTYVNTKVQIWPKLHLAYTEKMISVYNTSQWRTEEAIYTFQLPEGGVVTSLSLWINGKEEKSILTTREKADSAYRTIVGVEKRDPSLVRWQEGNTVSVRVFPVEENESRQFKIGFTAPLAASNQQLLYRNSWFKGPRVQHTPEDVVVEFMTPPVNPFTPKHFQRTGNTFTADKDYEADWAISMNDEGLDSSSFSFNGYEYTMKPYTMQRTPAITSAIYLDVNAAWTEEECRQVISMAGSLPVFVWHNESMKRAEEGYLQPLLKQNFSLFPVHRIKDPATALLITKSTGNSPHLSELEGSGFKSGLMDMLAQPQLPKIRLLDMGAELSPYLKTLKEQRVFRYEKGGLLLFKVLLGAQSFAADIETPEKVVIDEANLVIEKKPGTSAGAAPDHLMRLFAYNHIMQQKGRGAMPDSLVALAQEACVVTPLTSLVVLETQKDYDRFGIKDSGNSLKNASAKSNGAVPEPHEWALIILALLTLAYVKFKPVWNRQNV